MTAAFDADRETTAVRPIAVSPAMREVLDAARDVAATPTTVLLLGESGTGKELLARFLHVESGRHGPWVAVNCAALPSELLESELFGHEKGAFTGASERRAGRFEQAHRGTLLLDEISELPLPLQAKLLRVLQEREVDRVGGQRPIPVDARVVATSNRDLADMVRRGLFRSDLYYRLNVFPIAIPPLRERREDLPALAAALAAELAAELGRRAPELDPSALAALGAEPFPGNIRELRNVLQRALVRCRGERLGAAHLAIAAVLAPASRAAPPAPERLDSEHWLHATAPPLRAVGDDPPGEADDARPTSTARPASWPSHVELPLDLTELERIAIAEALRRVNGNRTHAARILGIGLRTLRNKLRAYREAGVDVEAAGAAGGQTWPPAPAPSDGDPRGAASARDALLRARASQEEGS